jgi:hypothetical protein
MCGGFTRRKKLNPRAFVLFSFLLVGLSANDLESQFLEAGSDGFIMKVGRESVCMCGFLHRILKNIARSLIFYPSFVHSFIHVSINIALSLPTGIVTGRVTSRGRS